MTVRYDPSVLSAALKQCSEDQLIEELMRRRNAREQADIKDWCHDCAHYATDPRADDTYNPCQRNHKMKFKVPDSEGDYDWGFYRRVCADRTACEEPSA